MKEALYILIILGEVVSASDTTEVVIKSKKQITVNETMKTCISKLLVTQYDIPIVNPLKIKNIISYKYINKYIYIYIYIYDVIYIYIHVCV